jgi:hypothetical protein
MSGCKKLDWIVQSAGMGVRPDYFELSWRGGEHQRNIQLPVTSRFLEYVNRRYDGAFWNKPRERWRNFALVP